MTSRDESADKRDASASSPTLRHEHPRILVVDLPSTVREVLCSAGFNATDGTFGTPHEVDPDAAFLQPPLEATLPGYTEQEVIVVDVAPPASTPYPSDVPPTPVGEEDLWARKRTGIVDPRPRGMRMVRERFDRILDHGGVFIVFTHPRRSGDYVVGRATRGGGLTVERNLNWDNWEFLSLLDDVRVTADHGQEIRLCDGEIPQAVPLDGHLGDASFTCTLDLSRLDQETWARLAENKYGQTVAATIRAEEGGWIFLLPRVRRISPLLLTYLTEFLPGLAPDLFPSMTGGVWTGGPEYEHPRIRELEKEIEAIRSETQERIGRLEETIEGERTEWQFLHDLLTETGDALVAAVITALTRLGFAQVIDVDASDDPASTQLREDIQVRDGRELIVVEVKGVGGHATEEDALTVIKYVNARMRERNTTDVRGLSIINTQRRMPGLDRDNVQPFSKDVVTTAEQQQISLLTTWDLYRLTRSFLQLGWRHEDVAPLFYRAGRVHPIPEHYTYVGVVEDFWGRAGAIGIRLDGGQVKTGDLLAYELPAEFREERADSLQVDGMAVAEAGVGAPLGVRTSLSKADARKGVRVFLVRSTTVHGGDNT